MSSSDSEEQKMQNSKKRRITLHEHLSQLPLEEIENEHPSQTDLSEGDCHIDQLPPEVLQIILKFVHERKMPRLVCKTWYNVCSFNVKLYFCFHMPQSKYLEKCGLSHLNIRFSLSDLNVFPTSTWKIIGSRINSLDFHECRLGDLVVENFISYCNNLQVLRISPKLSDLIGYLFSLRRFEELGVTQEKLNTLQMGYAVYYADRGVTDSNRLEIFWKSIYRSLYRIFPNIVHHIVCPPENPPNQFFSCTTEPGETSKASLGSFLALLQSSYKIENWREALRTLPRKRIRLTSFTLRVQRPKLTQEDWFLLCNFFAKQKKLKSLEIDLQTPDFNNLFYSLLLVYILDVCDELRELKFPQGIHVLDHILNLESSLLSKFSNLKSIHMDSFKLTGTSLYFGNFTPVRELKMHRIIPAFAHLHHLSIENASNKDFQSILQNMINLRSLKVSLACPLLNNYGLIGYHEGIEGDPEMIYSIKRLQKLERLCLHSRNSRINDTIYDEFDFPELRYLCSFPPEEPSKFTDAGTKMPFLTEIDLLSNRRLSCEYLAQLVQFIPKLQTLHVSCPSEFEDEFCFSGVQKIFEVCPSLRRFDTKNQRYTYESSSGEIQFALMDHQNQRKCHELPRETYF